VPGVSTALTISGAARASGVSAHTLRYYERAGLLDPVGRGHSGHRRYGDEDLARIHFLTRLRATGMPIRQIRAYADLVRRGEDTNEARMAMLEAHRDAVRGQLAETQHNLDLIDKKIDHYRERLAAS
jgi:DNA-binding transcriptional MerR regulator